MPFFFKHQAQQLKNKIETVQPDEIIFRIDFSENCVCKYNNEIQAVHFGASKRQLALNTGLVYFEKNGKPKSECFASISNNLDHQAHAVWGHMSPILKHYSSKFPKTVTFFLMIHPTSTVTGTTFNFSKPLSLGFSKRLQK